MTARASGGVGRRERERLLDRSEGQPDNVGRCCDTTGSYYDSNPAVRIAGSAALGGTAAELSGDKFENGAATGALSRCCIGGRPDACRTSRKVAHLW
jgi:hypothetical protein